MIELNMLSTKDRELGEAGLERGRRVFKKTLRVTGLLLAITVMIGVSFSIVHHRMEAKQAAAAETLRLDIQRREMKAHIQEKERLEKQRQEEERTRLRFEAFRAIVGKLTYEQWLALTDEERQAILAAAVQEKE